jgi:arylsulfatase A-like enzyme
MSRCRHGRSSRCDCQDLPGSPCRYCEVGWVGPWPPHARIEREPTAEVRRDIDWELGERGIDFMKRQSAAGKPFFLYLPISRTHFPNLPSKRFEGASSIGQFGDSLMKGDAIVGRMLDALRETGARAKHHRRVRL